MYQAKKLFPGDSAKQLAWAKAQWAKVKDREWTGHRMQDFYSRDHSKHQT